MTNEAAREFIVRTLPALVPEGGSVDAGYALPPRTLALLERIVAALNIRRVFEFGSGQSTRTFIQAGCAVTAVEDSAEWLAQTAATLTADEHTRFHSFCLPLQAVWLAGAPFRAWRLPSAALDALRAAELVLIDSPALPPFREHALALTIATARNAIIVVDDAAIPTVARFCRSLAGRNAAPHDFISIDHGLFVCGPAAGPRVDLNRPWTETVKAWRRFFHPRAGA